GSLVGGAHDPGLNRDQLCTQRHYPFRRRERLGRAQTPRDGSDRAPWPRAAQRADARNRTAAAQRFLNSILARPGLLIRQESCSHYLVKFPFRSSARPRSSNPAGASTTPNTESSKTGRGCNGSPPSSKASRSRCYSMRPSPIRRRNLQRCWPPPPTIRPVHSYLAMGSSAASSWWSRSRPAIFNSAPTPHLSQSGSAAAFANGRPAPSSIRPLRRGWLRYRSESRRQLSAIVLRHPCWNPALP